MLLVNTVALLSLGNLYARNQHYFNFAVNAGAGSLVWYFRASFVLALSLIVHTVFLLLLAV